MPRHFLVRRGSIPTSDWHEPDAETKMLGKRIQEMRIVVWFRQQSEKVKLAEEEEERQRYEREEQERIEAQRGLRVCVH